MTAAGSAFLRKPARVVKLGVRSRLSNKNLLVHLDHADLPAAFGHIDQRESAPLLLAQFGHALQSGEEAWAGQKSLWYYITAT